MSVDIEHARSNNIGALLKASRDRLGEDVYAVSRALRIRQRYLQAIEDGTYDELPGPTYAVGFVRAYAEYVGLDGEEVVRRFKAETSALNGAAELRFPAPVPESGVPGGAVLLIGLLIAGLAYGTWYVLSERDGFLAEVISPLPERFRSLVDGDDGEPGPAQAPTEGSPSQSTSAASGTSATASVESDPAAPPSTGTGPAGSVEREPASAATTEDAASYPPPPLPGEMDGDRDPDVADAGSGAQASPDATGEAAPNADTPGEVAAVPAPSEDTDPSDGNEGDAVGEIPEPRPIAAATSETATDADTPSDGQGMDTRDTDSTGASNLADAADASPMPTAVEADPAPAPGDTVPLPSAAFAEPSEDAPADSTDDASGSGDQVAMVPDDPRPDRGPAVRTDDQGPISGGRVFGETADVRIIVRARIDSWIQVRDDRANRMLLTRLLRAGDVYRVPDRPGLKLSTGDAGALEILVDGEPVPPIGGDGIVRRSVALDVERLRQGAAVSE